MIKVEKVVTNPQKLCDIIRIHFLPNHAWVQSIENLHIDNWQIVNIECQRFVVVIKVEKVVTNPPKLCDIIRIYFLT